MRVFILSRYHIHKLSQRTKSDYMICTRPYE